MNYLLMPLDQHFDGGLGATGATFEESAKLLSATHEERDNRLPICFLYRHAIELYLKSVIVVLHRALKIPYGASAYDGPAFVLEGSKWTPIFRVHSVAVLWAHVLKLINESEAEIKKRCRTDWHDVPADLISGIKKIEIIDGSSTFFRYPDGKIPDTEQVKSMWKSRSVDDVQMAPPPGAKPVKLFLLLDQDDQITQAFEYDDAAMAEIVKLLANTAETLSCMHVGLRMELAGGF